MDDRRPARTNYPSNSHKGKEAPRETSDRPKVEKVVKGKVTRRKKSIGKKLAETFTAEDSGSVGDYILFDVIIPAAKAMLADAASQGAERMLFGDVRRTGTSSYGARSTGYTAYNKPNSGISRSASPSRSDPALSRRAKATHNFNEVVMQTRGDAQDVIDGLVILIEQYDIATVRDLYDLLGLTASFTDEKWGWTDLRESRVVRVRDGYLLDLPPTENIE